VVEALEEGEADGVKESADQPIVSVPDAVSRRPT
jgi:hypothetical protein